MDEIRAHWVTVVFVGAAVFFLAEAVLLIADGNTTGTVLALCASVAWSTCGAMSLRIQRAWEAVDYWTAESLRIADAAEAAGVAIPAYPEPAGPREDPPGAHRGP